MLILVVSILLLGALCAILGFLAKGGKEQPVDAEPTCATCNGEDTKCEQECMMEAAIKDIEYYDDEQLDKFQGRDSASYDDDEIEEFADVLYTLKDDDVAGWNRSLILRNINIPNQLKDDLIALLSKASVVVAFIFTLFGIQGCSTQKNTSASRWWHSFNARYNTYFNGSQAYIEGSLEKENGNKDNYTEMLPLYYVGNKASRELGKTNFETAVTKAQKAIKQHSIKKRPQWTKSRKKTERDIEWLNRREYNPFLWKAWMLMGRSQFHSGAFDEAAATFSYMSRLYKTQPAIYGKARAWLAKCYIEQDWLYDAEDVIRNMSRDSIDWRARKEWDYTLADYYLRTGDLEQSVVYLRQVIRHEMRSKQRAREWYILGQVYAALGKNMEAYAAFRRCIRQNPPYELEFNARISMTEVMPRSQAKSKIGKLKAMARSDKNSEYLDQVYYAMGNVYLAENDTVKAITAYERGNREAARSGIEKGVLLLHLGDLYWATEKFGDARRCYGEAIGLLDSDRKDYEQLSERSKILDLLAPHTDNIHLQDSLQSLAKMDEKDRNAAIDRVIDALKKKEKEERLNKLEEEARNNAGQGNVAGNTNANTSQTTPFGQNSTFYFYNPAAVQQGKQMFVQQWGRRDNADDWQRANKTVVASASWDKAEEMADSTDMAVQDSLSMGDEMEEQTDSAALDPHKREYYLAQIPFTEEQLAASSQILSDALFNAGVIFKDKLDNLPLSEKELKRLSAEFPGFEKNDELYYHLFLLYSRKGDFSEAEQYKRLLAERHSDSQWSKIVNDPNFADNMRYGTHKEDSLYAETYDAFKADNFSTVSRNTLISEQRYPLGAHRDKFLFVGGMTRLNQGDADSCLHAMERVVNEYPESEVSPLAGMIINGVKAGRKLRGAKFDISNIWDYRSAVLAEDADTVSTLSSNADEEFIFLMTYNPDSLNENQLLYSLAKYNFTSYLVRNFDIEIENFSDMHRLAVSGFRNFGEALVYARALYSNTRIMTIAKGSRNVVISRTNLPLLGVQFSYNDYDKFYSEHFAPMPKPAVAILEEQIVSPELYDPELKPSTEDKVGEPETEDSSMASEDDGIIVPVDVSAESESEDMIEAMPDIPIVEDATGNDDGIVITQESVSLEVEVPTEIQEKQETESGSVNQLQDIPVPDAAEKSQPQVTAPVERTTTVKSNNEQQMQNGNTVRMDINSDILEIIDEEAPNSTAPANGKEDRKEPVENDDEYFDFDGF
ncbi:MAG: tetratricopeptide repeat protein [Bacteroidales bacterium]|nr:tetratricopeptide repeat protein [Bacteroidales bacterium]MCM1147061.1 tetratricopeptide repeat protein [Bacteroidales bacterium]MCM1205806.1 tetratricopeptide repeat protein [Bacillota bacterium]MCM1509951.1 tetratricopeptide repeat protein [Clostridium sp.]